MSVIQGLPVRRGEANGSCARPMPIDGRDPSSLGQVGKNTTLFSNYSCASSTNMKSKPSVLRFRFHRAVRSRPAGGRKCHVVGIEHSSFIEYDVVIPGEAIKDKAVPSHFKMHEPLSGVSAAT